MSRASTGGGVMVSASVDGAVLLSAMYVSTLNGTTAIIVSSAHRRTTAEGRYNTG